MTYEGAIPCIIVNTPKLRSVANLGMETKYKIENMIYKTLGSKHIECNPIEHFTITELVILTEYARENNILVNLYAEHSSFHQGVVVQLLKKELVNEFKQYL